MEWGRQRLIWLLLGHAAVSQLASRFTPKVGRDPHGLIGAQQLSGCSVCLAGGGKRRSVGGRLEGVRVINLVLGRSACSCQSSAVSLGPCVCGLWSLS